MGGSWRCGAVFILVYFIRALLLNGPFFWKHRGLFFILFFNNHSICSVLHSLCVGKFDALWSHADESSEDQKKSENAEEKAGKKKKKSHQK